MSLRAPAGCRFDKPPDLWYRGLNTSDGGSMAVKIVDLHEVAAEGKRKILFDTPKFSTWVHVYSTPKKKMDMHAHNYDESFYLLAGECTMHFPDQEKVVMKPGMVAMI